MSTLQFFSVSEKRLTRVGLRGRHANRAVRKSQLRLAHSFPSVLSLSLFSVDSLADLHKSLYNRCSNIEFDVKNIRSKDIVNNIKRMQEFVSRTLGSLLISSLRIPLREDSVQGSVSWKFSRTFLIRRDKTSLHNSAGEFLAAVCAKVRKHVYIRKLF